MLEAYLDPPEASQSCVAADAHAHPTSCRSPLSTVHSKPRQRPGRWFSLPTILAANLAKMRAVVRPRCPSSPDGCSHNELSLGITMGSNLVGERTIIPVDEHSI